MPSFASVCRAWTAWAATWAAECRRMASPSGLSMAIGSTSAPAGSGRFRSRNSPLTRTATTVLSSR